MELACQLAVGNPVEEQKLRQGFGPARQLSGLQLAHQAFEHQLRLGRE